MVADMLRPLALALAILATTPALAANETVALLNETTDAFTLSVEGGPTCTASPRSHCLRSAKTGANAVEACSTKQCFKQTVTLATNEVLRWTVTERNGKYELLEERRTQRPQ